MDDGTISDASRPLADASSLPTQTPIDEPASTSSQGDRETSAMVCETCGGDGTVTMDVANYRHGHDSVELPCPDCRDIDDGDCEEDRDEDF